MQDIQETQELIPKIRIAEEYIYIHRKNTPTRKGICEFGAKSMFKG